MIGEFIAEVILKPVLEIVLGGIAYHSGALVLSILTFGAMPLAPLDSLGDRSPGKLPWHQGILWRSRPGKRRELRAEWVCATGVLLWIGIGVLIYFLSRDAGEQPASPDHSSAAGVGSAVEESATCCSSGAS